MYQRHAECGGVTWVPPEATTERVAFQCDACEGVVTVRGEDRAVQVASTAEMDVR